ncbi:TraA/ATP-dependent exoDNAse/relaxase [Mycolicibacterium litorale]|uniref:TraA/ATP-dependent exoDNAse/relaxase n=1 Tax=Mycolicibacterium litorale TaxID=758802 RepID=A0A6S6P211_9MYCO|nr:TraA/ATP-dependent exoDNAse/relaxase [Mycolicibacterium litorale]
MWNCHRDVASRTVLLGCAEVHQAPNITVIRGTDRFVQSFRAPTHDESRNAQCRNAFHTSGFTTHYPPLPAIASLSVNRITMHTAASPNALPPLLLSQALHLVSHPDTPQFLPGTFAQRCENGCGAARAAGAGWRGETVLTIAKLKRWSINYYIDTAQAAERASNKRARSGGGLGEYYSEHETRTPVWLCAGDTRRAAALVGLTDAQRAGGEADAGVVARWLDDGVAPSGARGRAFGERGVHGFDLTFCAPKSVSLVRALRVDEVVMKAMADAHDTALREAMEYLSVHAGYTRVHNPRTGEKDLVRLPGLVAVAYQHETSRCGDPHLHTHVIVPNRQARADGALVSIDGTSLYHEARAAGVIYQATLRRELNRSMVFEWAPVDPSTGMAELAGVDRDTITAWSRRSTALREWAAGNLKVVEGPLSAAQLAAAQKATRPTKPEELAWGQLVAQWRADARGLRLDRAAFEAARAARRAAARTPFDRSRLAEAAGKIEKAAFTRADLVEIVGAQLPVDTDQSPREVVEAAVDEVGIRLTAPRAAHQREGHERFTLDQILAEEKAVLDLVDAKEPRAMLWIKPEDTAGLSPDQMRAVENIGRSPWLVQPLSAPAGAGKTTSLRALNAAVKRRHGGTIVVLAPTGKAVDVAVREGVGDTGYTIAKALLMLQRNELELAPSTLVVVDEAGMVGTDDLRQLLTATTAAGAKIVLVGDAHQLAPVKARGGMLAQLCDDLPWAQKLSEVWRMRDPEEREASLALRDGGLTAARRAVDWYRDHDRLHTGDQVTMAADALAAYRRDIAAGEDALLVCDTVEMADALNQRLHCEHLDPATSTVLGVRGQHIAVGDLILTRCNDPTIALRAADPDQSRIDAVRNGQRWRVAGVDPTTNRLAAQRLDDGARAVFGAEYLREHVSLGYAVTVHSAQGVTSDTTHAVLSENTGRALLYVAMTRGRLNNTAHFYERIGGDSHDGNGARQTNVVPQRGDCLEAVFRAQRALNDGGLACTAHDQASLAVRAQLPDRVRRSLDLRLAAILRRQVTYRVETVRKHETHADRSYTEFQVGLGRDDGLEL